MLNKKYAGARIRVVRVSMELLTDSLVTGHEFHRMSVSEGLPEGAEFVAVMPDWQLGVVEFVYMHDSWDEVPIGAYVPEQRMTINSHDDAPTPVAP